MVLTSGCFDGVHSGHIAYLEAAKALCRKDELLVCAVAPDGYIEASKGRRPYWPQVDRVRTVGAIQDVDAALTQVQASVAGVIRHYRPRLFVKGPDWEGRLPEDVQIACQDTGTALAYVQTPGTHVAETRLSDQEALARFEALVLSQSPATEPWQPVTPFDFESRKAIEGEHVKRLWQAFSSFHVLDYGCGFGHLVRLMRESGISAFGYEPYVRPAAEVAEFVIGPAGQLASDDFDVVICREVFEHCTLREVRRLVTHLCAISKRYVYVTTRFAKAPAHLLTVDTSDNLDPTHISMLNQTLLRALFVLEGFKRRADLEEKMDWKKLRRVLVYERV